MIIKCMLDRTQYSSKPAGVEIAKIQNKLESAKTDIEIQELAELLVKGCTFKPALLNGKKDADWIQQQIFALDFDENTTIQEELDRCKELNILPAFAYTSFSHTEEHHKFRLVFCANEVITDYELARKFQLTLMNIFTHCDEKCKNLSRLYFGGKQLIYEGFDNMVNYKDIINNHPIEMNSNTPHNSKDIVSNISNIVGRITNSEENYYNLKALRKRDAEYLKTKIGNPKILLENNQAFFDYIKGYDLANLLEIKYPTSFRCILHEDNNPSAGIFQNEEGTYIYHCFSCGVSYNIINLVEVLGNFKSRPKAYKFIREIFNLEIMDTEWQREQKEIIKENRRMLLEGELEKNCPTAYQNIKRNIRYLDQLLLIAEDNVYSEKFVDNDDNVIFFASTRYICKKLGLSEDSAKEVSKKNALFVYHSLLNKISNGEIPEDMLKKSQAISLSEDKNYKHINYYSIPSYTTNTFSEIENQGIKWQDNNYTMKGLSREMLYRSEGAEVANKVYPQYSHVYDKAKKEVVERTTSKKSDDRTIRIVQILFDLINQKGYAIEKEIINILLQESMYISRQEAEKQLKKSLNEILLSYNLKRIKSNKSIKEQYNVDAEGYPFLIVRNN